MSDDVFDRSAITYCAYTDLATAYGHFNERLFENVLPDSLITYQRKAGARGYYSYNKFATRKAEVTDEIALNPKHFLDRSDSEGPSTLAHEMVHQWQAHFGKPSRGGYHNKEWADKMESIGLMPSTTGKPGGRRTGQRVTHYIMEGGEFATSCCEFLLEHPLDLHGDQEKDAARKAKGESKTKYSCPGCGVNAWAKPNVVLLCGECAVQMMAFCRVVVTRP